MKSLITALIVILPLHALAADYSARVVGISDGDTLTVLRDGRTQVKIRLHGVDAPETDQEFGSRAKQAASELAYNNTVTIREMDRDRYERTVAEVILPDGRLMNRELVRQGMAMWYSAYAPHDQELARLQAVARKAHLGLWSQPNPIPPWDWRKGVGVPVTDVVFGNHRTHVYHAGHCRAVAVMKPENKVEFKTAAEAEEKGYRKAGDCR